MPNEKTFASCFASPYAPLSPAMMLPRRRDLSTTFPFCRPDLYYFFLCRNAVYALAQYWKLECSEVLFPAYFHGVELEALLAARVRPRFYRVDRHMCVDLDDLLSKMSGSTRAVYLIHYLGFPGPVREIHDLCQERGVLLIEDCALALLSRNGEAELGSYGDAAAFCLYKTLPVPDGGALLLPEGRTASVFHPTPPSLKSTTAMTTSALSRYYGLKGHRITHRLIEYVREVGKSMLGNTVRVGTSNFDPRHVGIGMSRVSSWIIAAQDFPKIVSRRRRNFTRLHKRLAEISEPVFESLPPGVCPLFYPIRTHDKTRALQLLLARGVEAVNFWSNTHPALPAGAFPDVDELRRTIVELPCHQELTIDAVDRIADIVSELLPDLN